jgi:UPF0755 protein
MRSRLSDARRLVPTYALLVVLVVTLALRAAPGSAAEALRVPPPAPAADTKPVTFTVAQGMSPDDVASALQREGVLTDVRRFNLLLGLNSAGRDLRAGCYVFAPQTPAAELIRRLRSGVTASQLIAIPEGRRLEEVGTIMAQAGIASRAQWDAALEAAPRSALPVPPPAGRSLLGYLLPASYPLQCKASAEQMIGAMLDAFAMQVTPAVVASIEHQGLTLYQGITLASIVEREAVLKAEQPVIASVFLNRLKAGIALQADPTVQFALASKSTPPDPPRWWKTALTDDDLLIDSLYNTYRYPGLPPGPIANPGIDAIRAVASPAANDYLYFVAKGDGSHAFARTLVEHNANVARYQRP